MSEDLSQIAARFDALRSRFDTLYTQGVAARPVERARYADPRHRQPAGRNRQSAQPGLCLCLVSGTQSRGSVRSSWDDSARRRSARHQRRSQRACTSEVNRLRYRVDTGEGLRGNPSALAGAAS